MFSAGPTINSERSVVDSQLSLLENERRRGRGRGDASRLLLWVDC